MLPYDKSLCRHGDEIPCSGPAGCRCEVGPLRAWNDSLGGRWTWLIEYLRRELKGCDVQFFKTYEPQQRGAQHVHAMFRITGPVSDRRVRAAFRLVAHRWGFGRQLTVDTVDLANPLAIARTAGYCAKYAAKSSDADRSMLDTATGEIITLHLRAWSKSYRWGESMKSIRQHQQAWAVAGGALAQPADPVGAGGGAALDLNRDFYTEGTVKAPALVSVEGTSAM